MKNISSALVCNWIYFNQFLHDVQTILLKYEDNTFEAYFIGLKMTGQNHAWNKCLSVMSVQSFDAELRCAAWFDITCV